MSEKEIPKVYEPQRIEDSIYKKWEESGFFNPDNLPGKRKEAFTISMPPPNATGILHIGHAEVITIQDLVIRYQRMKGKKVLWLPGTDHAAIATTTKVEKLIKEKEGKTRHDLGREEFLKRVKKFVADSQNTIRNQIRKMGSSCDWSRERYTMDEGLTKAVTEAFVRMYKDDLIYQGNRIVNWCPRCASTLADDEVEYREQKAKFYYIKYGPFVIATTRPETKLGDTAAAVNQNDARYKDYIGKEFDINLGKINIHIKVIADEGVDPKLGTGVVGVTPAHSAVDFEMAQKNNLPVIQVIGPDGKMTNKAGPYAGMLIEKCREVFVQDLRQSGLIEKIEEVDNNLSICYRCGHAIEPLISKQWFIAVNKPVKKFNGKTIKDRALEVVKNGDIEIIPERFKKVYYHWLKDLRDWCISRQIWFGHRIPVYYRKREIPNPKFQIPKVWDLKIYGEDIFNCIKNGTKTIETRAGRPKGTGKEWSEFKTGDVINFSLADEKTDQVIPSVLSVRKKIKKVEFFESIEDLFKIYKPGQDYPGKTIGQIKEWWKNHPPLYERLQKYGIWVFELADDSLEEEIYVGAEPPKGEGWEQDSDTLDTWFSSGLWTFSTLGWPKKTKDLETFHPTSLMETGYDILFFWVARMIIMSTYFREEVPFRQVYLHGLIRDERGRKMSKSLDNAIDPLDVVAKFGADAVRLSLLIGTTPGNDLSLSEAKIGGYRNFVNKLWNISRYILITDGKIRIIDKQPKPKTLADKWILAELNQLIDLTTKNLDKYNFSLVGEKVYEFTWSKLADWYVEVAKIEKDKDKILLYILQILLKLWHPFTPFVTEAIWKKLDSKELLIIQPWPEVKAKINEKPLKDFEIIKKIITAIRNLRAVSKIPPGQKLKAIIIAGRNQKLIIDQAEIIKGLARLSDLEVLAKGKKPAKSLSAIVSNLEIYLPVSGMINIDKEIDKLSQEARRIEEFIVHLEGKLKNQRFLDRAPKEIIEAEKEKLESNQKKLEKINQQLKTLK